MAVKNVAMYSLIICDYSMPEMDGPQVAKAIRLILNGIFEPVICCCTAYQEQTFKTNAMLAGMDQYLVKPLTDSELDGLLKSVKT